MVEDAMQPLPPHLPGYPGSHVNKVAVDFYASEYDYGYDLSTMVAIADNASPPKKLGIWEMGVTLTNTVPSMSQITSYFSYVQSVMAGRLQAGKSNAEIVWFNGGLNNISNETYLPGLWAGLVAATS